MERVGETHQNKPNDHRPIGTSKREKALANLKSGKNYEDAILVRAKSTTLVTTQVMAALMIAQ